MSRSRWLLPGLLLAGAVGGLALHGPMAVSGIATGLLGAVVLRRMGAPTVTCSMVVLIAPLIPAAGAPLAAPAALGLVAAYQRLATPWVFLASAAGLVFPGSDGVLVPTLGGALFSALAPARWMAVGVPLVIAPWLAGLAASPLTGGALLAGASVCRGLAAHPANATIARSVVQFGLAASPVPAAVGVVFAAVGGFGEQVIVVSYVATSVILAGAYLAATHVGLGVLLRSRDALPGVWLLLSWSPGFVAGASLVEGVAGRSVPLIVALAGLSVGPAALGMHWLFRTFARSRGGDSRVHGIIRNVHSPAASSAAEPERPPW